MWEGMLQHRRRVVGPAKTERIWGELEPGGNWRERGGRTDIGSQVYVVRTCMNEKATNTTWLALAPCRLRDTVWKSSIEERLGGVARRTGSVFGHEASPWDIRVRL